MSVRPGHDSGGHAPRRTASAPLATAVVVLLLILSACAGGGGSGSEPTGNQIESASPNAYGSIGSVEIREAFIPPPPTRGYPVGSSAVIGLILVNNGSAWDSLTSVSTPFASRVVLMQYNIPQDFLSMTTDPKLTNGAAQMVDLTQSMSSGQRVPVTFHFSSAGTLTLEVPVRAKPATGTT